MRRHLALRQYLAVCLALLGLSIAVAEACGPTRMKELESITIDAPADKVWAVVGAYADMTWHPNVGATAAVPAPDQAKGARRNTWTSGAVVTDTLESRDDKTKVIRFLVDEGDPKVLPVRGYASTITVTAQGGSTVVEWKGAYSRSYLNNDPPPELSDEAATAAVTAYQHAGLEGLKRKLETSATTTAGPDGQTRIAAASTLSAIGAAAAAEVAPSEPAAARGAFITNQLADSLSIVDLTAGKSVAEIHIGGKPAGVALSPDGAFAYITSPEGKLLTVVDTGKREIVRRITLDGGPLGMAVNPQSGVVYVADWYSHKVVAVDAAKSAVVGEVEVGLAPSGLAVTPDGATLLSADRDSNALSVIDAAKLQRIATIPVGEHPFGVTIDADAKRAYTANVVSNDVTVVDLAARKAIATVKVGARPYAVALAQGRAFVTDQHAASVSVINLASLTVEKTIDVGEFPEGIETDPSGRHVYVACWDANTLEKIDAATLEVVARIPVGNGPRAFGRFLR